MLSDERTGPTPTEPALDFQHRTPRGNVSHPADIHDHLAAVARDWGDIEWEKDPALAYLRGLQDGAALERGYLDAAAYEAHRAAVQEVRRQIEWAHQRAAADSAVADA